MTLRALLTTTLLLSSLTCSVSAKPVKASTILAIDSNSHAKIVIKTLTDNKKEDSYLVPKASQHYVNAFLKDNTLYLRPRITAQNNKNQLRSSKDNSDQPQAAHATVYLHQLNRLVANNNTTVVAADLVSRGLKIQSINRGKIDLNGAIVLEEIDARGNTWIEARWVSSKQIKIAARGNARIKLAGIARNIRILATDKASVDTQYLRAENAEVQTRGSASVKVNPIVALRAFAFDNSNIYVYKQPKKISRFTKGSGNIVQIDWRQ